MVPTDGTVNSENIDGTNFNGLIEVIEGTSDETQAFWQYKNGVKQRLISPPINSISNLRSSSNARKPNNVCWLYEIEYQGNLCDGDCNGPSLTDFLTGNTPTLSVGQDIVDESFNRLYTVTSRKSVNCCTINLDDIQCSALSSEYVNPDNKYLQPGGNINSTTIRSGGGSSQPPPYNPPASNRTPYAETICSFVSDFLVGSVAPINLGLEQKGAESVALSKAQFALYTKLAFEELTDLGSTINQPSPSQINASYNYYQLAVTADNVALEEKGALPGDYKVAACQMVGSNIGAGDIINIPPDYKYLDEKKAKVANAFKALNALITECEDDLSNPMACQVADALTMGGYDIADNIFAAADGTVFMNPDAMADLYAALAPPAGPAARVTTTDDGFELVDGELIYTNGDCVVKIQEVSEVSILDNDIPEYTTTGNLIRIKNSDGQFVLLHEYPLKTSEQRQDVLKVIWDIVKPMDIGDFLYMSAKSAFKGNEPDANTLAFTLPTTKKVYINSEPSINPKLSNMFKLINVLYHESLHHQDIDGLNSFMDHVDIYYQNAQHPSFELMGEFPGSQRSTIENIAVRLLYHMKDATGFDLPDKKAEVNDFVNNFNNSSLDWSMRIEMQPDGFSSNIYIKPDGLGEYPNAITIDTQKLENYGD